ncbi:MAG TPA: 2-oxoacid:acceptor oxidoreductase family protein [Longimicrobiales bacterium]|nr:2-oxoacid:acceptor oxidoreductase family protein [Longimicrobiales bacterium]
MVEIRIHGRGGQGGVTLAKLVATSRFLTGHSVQAFGLYAAERSGAPIQAFCRFSPEPITDRSLIYEPDHVVILDPTLLGGAVTQGLKPGGWILVNTDLPLDQVAEDFPDNPVAVVDATAIALEKKLGTKSVPIVNTALAGAIARILEIPLEEMLAGLDHLGFGGGNVSAARAAFDAVAIRELDHAPGGTASARPAPAERTVTFLEGAGAAPPAIKTGNWATHQPHRQQYVPPCNHICPAGNDVQAFLHALAEDRVDDGLEILLRTTPFPSVCGRVCPAPCMASCNRKELDGAVNVRQLERLAGDVGQVTLPRPDPRPERVAVIGSGPGGLATAYHLARFGYGVTVYEGAPEVGGLLRLGIPDFRLPGDVLDREIDRITDLGVQMVTEHRVDRPRLMELARLYDAVLVATGLQELRDLKLGVGGSDSVMQGIDFLDRVKHGQVRLDGETVIVVGGGNTAMDAARSALRIGAKDVRIVYRRTRAEMPAIAEEIEEALEEGVLFHELVQPVALHAESQADGDGGTHGLQCLRMELGAPDASGRRRPVEVPDSDFVLPCTRVILALGQSPDLSVFPEGTEVREGDDLLGLLENPVFAVGDLATGDGTVAGAIGSGRRAALHIHQTFTGEVVDMGHQSRVRSDVEEWHDEVIRADALRMHLFQKEPEQHGEALDPVERRRGFQEIHQGLGDTSEARRCLSCGVCNECDICVSYCPEGVLKRVGHQLVFDYAYCKGCGICVTECPRNVIFMSHL